MNGSSSTILTISLALNRAKEHNARVEVLVDGSWYDGQVIDQDAYGVVLQQPVRVLEGMHHREVVGAFNVLVFRKEAISGVRLSQTVVAREAPALTPPGTIQHH